MHPAASANAAAMQIDRVARVNDMRFTAIAVAWEFQSGNAWGSLAVDQAPRAFQWRMLVKRAKCSKFKLAKDLVLAARTASKAVFAGITEAAQVYDEALKFDAGAIVAGIMTLQGEVGC